MGARFSNATGTPESDLIRAETARLKKLESDRLAKRRQRERWDEERIAKERLARNQRRLAQKQKSVTPPQSIPTRIS